ncbi:MAG: DUF1207 domain-containing protein [Ignavibacteria bacterium]|nr:DUF1207 domain-containing protein [Ignavibacteria bacterium]
MKLYVFTFFLLLSSLFGQSKLNFFPNELNIQPFNANAIEPKLGFLFHTGKNELRLDIGNSREILHYKIEENRILSFGADLFTFTKLSGEGEFHFPVDAIDYLFGINFGYKTIKNEYSYGIRFRLSHISAHFVDGHYDNPTAMWKEGRYPRVYSREFVEFFPFFQIGGFRSYIGFTHLLHVVPKSIGKQIYQMGLEYYFTNFKILNITPFIAYDFKLAKIEKYEGTNSINGGIKFGNQNGAGFSIMLNYFNGKSIHGEYYDYDEKYTSISFNLDF